MFLYLKYRFYGPRMRSVLYAALDVTPVTHVSILKIYVLWAWRRVCDLSYTQPLFLYSKYRFYGPRMQVVLYAALDVTPVTGDTCFYTQNICFVGRVCKSSYTRP
jgi:transposase